MSRLISLWPHDLTADLLFEGARRVGVKPLGAFLGMMSTIGEWRLRCACRRTFCTRAAEA
jgi:hypothetical protein